MKACDQILLFTGKIYKWGEQLQYYDVWGEHETSLALTEVHKGACGSHIGRKNLGHKFLSVGYYWPTLTRDNIYYIKKCDQYQRHTDLHHAPTELY